MKDFILYRVVKAASLLETIVASVIILITYGYFMITFIQINRPDKNSKQIQSYYEEVILCDSLQAFSNTGINTTIDIYAILHSRNAYGNNYINVSKENSAHSIQYNSFIPSNE